MLTISHRLSARMEHLGVKPSQLRAGLKKAGLKISRQSIHAWLSGDAKPSADKLVVVMEVLEVPQREQANWLKSLAVPRARAAA